MRTLEISYEEELDLSTLETSLRSVNLSTIETLKFENNGWKKFQILFFKNLAGANISTLSLNFNILLTFDASFLRPFNLVGKITCRNNRIERLVITNDFEKVKELDLTANQIVIIPKFCSANESTLAPSLEKLTLFDNAIRSLSSRSFRCLNKLRELILDNNRIIEIGNDIFLPLTSLERLSVSHLKLRKLESRAFNCISLQKLQFIQNDFKFTDLDRFDSKRRQRRSIRSDLPGTYEFDVYVVYCEKDRKWVHEVLLKRLEDEEFKVCIHCRDFPVGEDIVDNIEEFMNKSWKFIVIMSNNFAKSEWCQWEVNLVQARRRRRGKNAMVLIMLKQIDSKHMTSALRTLLYTTPYLSYIKGIGKRLFWTAVINGVKKSYDNSPVAVSFIS
ncbi:unnamed protein product [Mytilus edulis]|uniref:TIR domain-containing protein n=1 Tax=Mytilus edulis TaxID=6550 RepID=A0A8S3RYK2_MYTED|nr:unnamed protein product [Mytilus edulis]